MNEKGYKILQLKSISLWWDTYAIMTAPSAEHCDDAVEHCNGITQHHDGPIGIAIAKHGNVMYSLPSLWSNRALWWHSRMLWCNMTISWSSSVLWWPNRALWLEKDDAGDTIWCCNGTEKKKLWRWWNRILGYHDKCIVIALMGHGNDTTGSFNDTLWHSDPTI